MNSNNETEIVFSIKLKRENNKLYFDVLKKELPPMEEKCLIDFIRRMIIEERLRPFEGDKYLE